MPPEPDIDLSRYPVLVVDDEPDNLDAFRFNFRKGFTLKTATSGVEALELLEHLDPAVIVTDQRMPELTGLDLLKRAAELRPDALGIIITAYSDVDVLVEAINVGRVYRYVAKPWDAREVRGVLMQAIEHHHLKRENRRLAEQLRQYAGYLDYQAHRAFDFGAIIGESRTLAAVLEQVEQVAPTSSTVLLRGETGTGKEMVARALHLNSGRADAPFVAVNCAALPTDLLESELFGHEKGAFTNAIAQRRGRFELASGGTIFLDEIGDLPMDVQIKLLRVLQERELQRVGSTETIKIDVRVISATNRDLERMVEQGRFREDLYYRLNVFWLQLPPLRDRDEDVLLLAEHFLERFRQENRRGPRSIAADAAADLMAYDWPGNVRELQNVIERTCIICRGEELTRADLDFGPRALAARRAVGVETDAAPAATRAAGAAPLRERLQEEERDAIVAAIESSGGNIAAAARTLGVNRSTLYFRIKKFQLEQLLPGRLDPPQE